MIGMALVLAQIAIAMLESGAVEAVVCVQSDPEDRFTPRPVRTAFPGLAVNAGGQAVTAQRHWQQRQVCTE